MSLPLLVVLAAALPSALDREASTNKGIELLKEGDALADQGKPNEAQLKYKDAFEQILPGMRRIKFKKEVGQDVTPREELSKFLIEEIDEEQTAEEQRGSELAYRAFGLISKDLDLKKVLVDLYTEEIAAFYDPRTGKMHLIKEPEPKEPPKPAGFFEQLFGAGRKGGFNKEEAQIVIAHELTHALADQNYNLFEMQQRAKGDDDRALALSSLIEGEATLTMMAVPSHDWSGDEIVQLPAGYLNTMFGLAAPFLNLGGGKALQKAPPILADSLIFPYLRGVVFCAHLTNAKGWKALDDAYHSPPLSTEQIIHPEKYRDAPDPPREVDLGDLEAGTGWREAYRNVMGEMQTAILLKKYNGKGAAAGWGGDTYAAFEGPEGKLGLVWRTAWDSEADAREFAASYIQYQSQKEGLGEPGAAETALTLIRGEAGRCFAVERRGSDVVVVEGFGREATAKLSERAFAAETREKTDERPPVTRRQPKGS